MAENRINAIVATRSDRMVVRSTSSSSNAHPTSGVPTTRAISDVNLLPFVLTPTPSRASP